MKTEENIPKIRLNFPIFFQWRKNRLLSTLKSVTAHTLTHSPECTMLDSRDSKLLSMSI